MSDKPLRRDVTVDQREEDVTILKIGDRSQPHPFQSEDLTTEQLEANYVAMIHGFEMKRHEAYLNMIANPVHRETLEKDIAEYEVRVRRLKEDRDRWRSELR